MSLEDRVNKKSLKNAAVRFLDVNDLTSVNIFVDKFYVDFNLLDFIVINANEMNIAGSEVTVQGYEKSFGTLYMSNFLLVRLLLPLLTQKSESSSNSF